EMKDDNSQTPEWTLNVSGKIFRRAGNITTDNIDIENLKTEFKNKIETEIFYSETRADGIEYDGNFKLLNNLFVKDNSSFAEINATDEIVSQFKDYLFHPVLMDACLHTSFAPLLGQMNPELIYLPIGINSINIYGNAEKDICSLLEYDSIKKKIF
ncbi:MAG: polyketide synthase dehydratase domain-containing protein, partial [Ignavibacteriae bacterium]|nr:polyketide synthase dehydratase domain-containing protein [Ignavibacteriota bacterium]